MKKRCLLYLLLLLSTLSFANTDIKPIPVDQSFVLSADLFGEDTAIVKWQIAPDHYLYTDRFKFKIISPKAAEIGHILAPLGIHKTDPLGDYQVYEHHASLTIPLINVDATNTVLQVQYQGCSEQGYCYPPVTKQLRLNFTTDTTTVLADKTATVKDVITPRTRNQQQHIIDLLSDKHLFSTLLSFLGIGLLLSLTPCVLPMVPILSGIIVGHEKTHSRGKSFRLSCVYVLSMAMTYAAAGVLVGWVGGSVQTLFQQTWLLVLSSLIFVALALAFFGLYSLKLPAAFEARLSKWSRHQKKGHYMGVAVMGCLATLIISPCVTPALVGVLGYISQTGNAIIGGISLFALGLGMGLPLLAVGFAGTKLLPKAGGWMQTIEYIFGVVFLGMAIWMLSRVIPPAISLALWGVLTIVSSVYLGVLQTNALQGWGKLWRGLGYVFLIYGALLIIGAAKGHTDPLQPLANHHNNMTSQNTQQHPITIKTYRELETILAKTPLEKPVLLDFYADWCVSCKYMEQRIYPAPKVQQQLANFIWLKADITANDQLDKELMRRLNVIAPPAFLVFDKQGKAQTDLTRVGEMNASTFTNYLTQSWH